MALEARFQPHLNRSSRHLSGKIFNSSRPHRKRSPRRKLAQNWWIDHSNTSYLRTP